jgi:hypothetical protein
MRWKAAPLIALLLLGPGLALAAEPVNSYPSADTCAAAEHVPCTRQTDGTWTPRPTSNDGGSAGPGKVIEHDEYFGMRTARAAQTNWSGEADQPIVMVDMDKVEFPDAKPYLDHETNRVRVPIRFVAEAMGAKVDWEPVSQTVTITRDGLEIKLVIDQATAIVNDKPLEIDSPAKLVENRTMVPLRFISEAFGAKVDWVGTEPPVPDSPEWGDYQVWIWIPWGYWGTATIQERILVYSWWWHRDKVGN